MPPRKIVKKFDVPKLQKMQEPITVRVVKTKGQQKTPVNIPGKDDGPPGTGWAIADVLSLEQFVQDAAGGGYYDADATDAGGDTMEWTFGWDPRTIPEKMLPGSESNTMPAPMPPAASPAPAPGYSAAPAPGYGAPAAGYSGNGWLSAHVPAATPQPYRVMPPAAPVPAASWPWSNPYGNNPYHTMFGGGDSTSRSSAAGDRERDLQEQLRQAQMAQQQTQYQQQLDRIQMQHTSEQSKMREEMRRVTDQPRGESDEVKELKVQLAAQQQAQQTQQMIQALQQNTQTQIDSLKEIIVKISEGGSRGESEQIRMLREEQRRAEERFERTEADRRHRDELLALKADMNKADPMIEYMKESSRQSAETQKEIARNQRESSQMMTTMMINPTQMIDMMQRSSGKNDEVTRTLVTNFGSAFETYRQIMESMVSMSSGGQQSVGATMLQDGMARASEIANQYMAMQRDKAVHEAKAKAQVANAQAKQAEAMRYAQQQPRPPGYDQDMLRGDPGAQNAPATPTRPPPGAPTASAQDGGADVINLQERRRPTEVDMFGAALESVQHLRAGVVEGKLTPEQAVAALLQGIAMCEQQKIVVPAFTLFAQGQFADLWDALLPKTSQGFKDACVQILFAQFEVQDGDEDGEDEDEEEDDGRPAG